MEYRSTQGGGWDETGSRNNVCEHQASDTYIRQQSTVYCVLLQVVSAVVGELLFTRQIKKTCRLVPHWLTGGRDKCGGHRVQIKHPDDDDDDDDSLTCSSDVVGLKRH